jgi:hydroxymethylpyrimidine/phosphomethylpyrimidine kinase
MITGFKIISHSDASKAAKKMLKLGAKNVIIKGNCFRKRQITDVLFTSEGRSIEISNPKLNIDDVHGSGCTFSAAFTAFIARDFSIIDSFKLANKYTQDIIQNALKIGKGHLVSNPAGFMYDYASRYVVLKALHSVVEDIETYDNFGILIPETQSNVVFALADARDLNDIAGIRGRLIKIGKTARSASSIVEFGASKHVGSALLAYMTVNRIIRSAMNIKYDEKIKKIVKRVFKVSNYDRRKEPIDIMKKEGSSIHWGIKYALAKNQEAEVICHEGSVGKEPMCIVFARDPRELISKIKIILKKYESV